MSTDFFFINNLKNINNCERAYFFLNTIWQFNILNALYICHHLEYELRLYSFNPFGETFSVNWKKVGSYCQQNGHPFTLFAYLYAESGKDVVIVSF